MKLTKTLIISLLLMGSSLLGLSTYATAGNLKVSNDSKYDLSFSINNICSSDFGDIDAHTIKVISEAHLKSACAGTTISCETKVFNVSSCAGKQVATVLFNINFGVQSILPIGITTKGNGFNLFFEGPWEIKNL